MKKIILVYFLLYAATSIAQPGLAWAKTIGGWNNDEVMNATTDAEGNVFLCGHIIGTVDVDPGPGIYNISSNSYYENAYLVKLDSLGNFVWAKCFNTANSYNTSYSAAVKTDTDGNVIITGTFWGSINCNPGGTACNLTANGYDRDIFVAKFDPDGNFIWARQGEGKFTEYVNDMSVDKEGDITICGIFSDTVDFDPGPAKYNLFSEGYSGDIFIWKLTSGGYLQYAKMIGGDSYDGVTDIDSDSEDNLYVAGYFSGAVDFDPGNGNSTLVAPGSRAFLLKLDKDANFFWVKELDSGGTNSVLSVDSAGNAYVTGSFYSQFDADPGAGVKILTSNGVSDCYVIKFRSSGDFVWGTSYGSTSYEYSSSIYVNEKGSVFLTGQFYDTLDFDPGTNEYLMVSDCNYYYAAYSLRLNENGDFVCAGKISCSGTYGSVNSSKLIADNNNNVYLYGSFYNIMDFDPGPAVFVDTSNGYRDIFICKFTPGNCCAMSSEPDMIAGTDTICKGGAALLSVEGGSLGDEAEWKWYKGNCTGPVFATGETINVFPETNTTYYVKAEGKCGATTCFPVTVQVKEKPKASITTTGEPNGLSVQLNAAGGKEYKWFPEESVSCGDCANIETSGYETTEYCVAVTDENGCTDTACTRVIVSSVYFPNAFTPNGDMLNEVFKPVVNEVEDYYFAVYNRWSEKIFETKNVNGGWTGNYNGSACEEGIYIYRVRLREKQSNKDFSYTGKVLLVR
jgi:gliding motility-associated-like protein